MLNFKKIETYVVTYFHFFDTLLEACYKQSSIVMFIDFDP